MKTLKKIKIINWHYFWNETIECEPIVFLTGLNASGKSTLIDAMLIILLGDTTGRYFNKAAMDKSSRTLKGYLRGELGDTDDGGFKYLRNGRFTSYIAMEFYDDVHDTSFTNGCVFDSFVDGTEEHRFFILDDKIPDNEFIKDELPMEYKTLNEFFSSNYEGKYRFLDSNKAYQDALKRKFGGLKDKYFSLLKKATSFTPITDITTFITEYVCDPQANINVAPMQENILQYKKLEQEAQVMEQRIGRLNEISETFSAYNQHKENFSLASYIIEKAELQMGEDRLNSYTSELESAKKRLLDIDIEVADLDANIAELNRKKTHLIQDKATSDTFNLTEELYDEKEKTNDKLKEIKEEAENVKQNLIKYCDDYQEAAEHLENTLKQFDINLLETDRANDVEELLKASQLVLVSSSSLKALCESNIENLTVEDLTTWKDNLINFKSLVSHLSVSLGRTITLFDQKTSSLKDQEVQMKAGTKSYDKVLENVRSELAQTLSLRHKRVVEVSFFADLIDIKTPLWVNAIEGFLHNQKFNLFVSSEYYLEAYDILKDLLLKYRFYGTSLVDQERIIEKAYIADRGSLAEEIITDHEGARSYSNFLIGRLVKCQTVSDARESGNGITPQCDLYRNFSLSKINPRFYTPGFIGRTVGDNQIKAKEVEINNNIELVRLYKVLLSTISSANTLELINTNEINVTMAFINKTKDIPGLENALKYIEQELGKHDLSQLESLDRRIGDIEEDINNLINEKTALATEKGNLENQIAENNKNKIPEEKKQIKERQERLDSKYDAFFVEEKALPAFKALLGKKMAEIVTEYNVILTRAQYLVSNLFSQLTKLRRDYVHDYHLSYPTEETDNKLYEENLVDLRDVKLPQYKAKIEDSYHKATKQFKDDFISKLRGAIESAEDQINELNEALSASTFGNDSYQFTCRPSAVYRPYYDMIKDELLLEIGEDDSLFLDKYRDTMNDLFLQIIETGEGDKNSALLANVEKFTDYRSYLDFDLIVKDKEGNEQRLSKMIKKKSGGETQTPFYIAVLASFAQLYHVNESGELSNSIRLIIFDEAFSKMDRGRIKESIRLLRKFGLQAILSAPSDKVPDISELVDETLVVLHTKNTSCVRKYKEEEAHA